MPAPAFFYTFVSIILWSFLGFLSASLQHLPPLLTTGIGLCIGSLVSVKAIKSWAVPVKTLAVGTGGLFGYHFLYFSAFQKAPAIGVNLVNYLWPIFIVLLTPLFLTERRLKANHIIGVIIGFCGAGMIVSGGGFTVQVGHLAGYLMAAAAALIWALYSLSARRFTPFPTGAVGAFCLIAGVFSLAAAAIQGSGFSIFNAIQPSDWLYLTLLGAGPLGIAFFSWEAALKRGDSRVVGSLAYFIPLFSTLILIKFRGERLDWVSGAAMLLIIGGAIIGSINTRAKFTGEIPTTGGNHVNETLSSIFKRRSIRKFKDQPVENEKLTLLLQAGMAAPSAMNNQPWEFIVVTDPDQLKKIREGFFFGKYNAPAAIVVCMNSKKQKRASVERFWVQDCSAAVENILIAAVSLGLGTVWLGVYPITKMSRIVSDIFSLPDHVAPLAVIYVGYPDEIKEPRTQYDEGRVHWQVYGNQEQSDNHPDQTLQ